MARHHHYRPSLRRRPVGYFLFRLQEQRQRLRTLHREFELQVAALRHHYKNLAIGISGFSNRIKRKLGDLPECEALERDMLVLDDASHRLSQTLGEELQFLKALTSDSLNPAPGDIYPLLKYAIRDLMSLRFKEKDLRVEINGQPLEAEQEPMIFPFEPYSMEVTLQNILSNAMKYADYIQVGVAQEGGMVQIEVRDNGPGVEVDRLKQDLLTPRERKPESSHLGLEVTLHLLEKCGGRLSVWSEPGAGAVFTLQFPT